MVINRIFLLTFVCVLLICGVICLIKSLYNNDTEDDEPTPEWYDETVVYNEKDWERE